METKVLEHYSQFDLFSHPGAYRDQLQMLPDDIRELGLLVRKNLIHRTTLAAGNTGTNQDLRFGDMTLMPWYRQPEDDIFQTAAAMLAELYRRDARGIVADRKVEDKLVLTCRYTAILTACIIKCKGIPARVRAGHADYFEEGTNTSSDHWITQYWHAQEHRWVTIDVDGSLSLVKNFDPYDIPDGVFDFPGPAWIAVRTGKVDPLRFWNAKPERGPLVLLWSLFYDFHCLMNHEIPYVHGPKWAGSYHFANLSPKQLGQIDHLAQLLCEPDQNFDELKQLWESTREFRILTGGLL